MIEVPDDEDNTSFRKWEMTNKIPSVAPEKTQPTVARSSDLGAKAENVPQEWLKLFEAEWTLRGIVEAKTESEARVILKNWIARGQAEEVVDKMIEGLQKATRVNTLEQMQELQQPRQYISQLSRKGKDLTIDIQLETLENLT